MEKPLSFRQYVIGRALLGTAPTNPTDVAKNAHNAIAIAYAVIEAERAASDTEAFVELVRAAEARERAKEQERYAYRAAERLKAGALLAAKVAGYVVDDDTIAQPDQSAGFTIDITSGKILLSRVHGTGPSAQLPEIKYDPKADRFVGLDKRPAIELIAEALIVALGTPKAR